MTEHALRNPGAGISESLRGLAPESWCCIDCGFNTAPGFPTRVEMEIAFIGARAKSNQQTIDDAAEIYTVRDSVWHKAGMESYGGCLCVGCLERRLGRRLKRKDFDPDHPFNSLPASPRLMQRQGRR